MNDELGRFLDHAVAKGIDYAAIQQMLRSSGWKDREIAEAFAARQLELPIPKRAGGSSARDTFLHLITFTSLYVWVIQLVVLLFNILDLTMPEPSDVGSESWRLSAIRGALAAIIIAFPLFLLLWRRLWQEIRALPEKATSPLRRWLTYLSLYVAAIAVLANAITLVYFLLEGEQTLRFLLKVLVLFVVAGSAFVYLSSTLHPKPGTQDAA